MPTLAFSFRPRFQFPPIVFVEARFSQNSCKTEVGDARVVFVVHEDV
jgi:hypothetical protein